MDMLQTTIQAFVTAGVEQFQMKPKTQSLKKGERERERERERVASIKKITGGFGGID